MKHYFKSLFLVFLAITFLISCSLALSSIHASMPNLYGKPDGVYRGEYSVRATPVKVVLDVTVQNEHITKINIIEHTASAIGKQAERIIPQIISRQSLNVDTVSGATASSKGILKAIENALQ